MPSAARAEPEKTEVEEIKKPKDRYEAVFNEKTGGYDFPPAAIADGANAHDYELALDEKVKGRHLWLRKSLAVEEEIEHYWDIAA